MLKFGSSLSLVVFLFGVVLFSELSSFLGSSSFCVKSFLVYQ